MHRTSVFVRTSAFVVFAVACGGRAYEDVSTSNVTSATSASVSSNAGGAVVDRLARAVCIHEIECGRVREPEMCVDASRARVGREVAAWTCDADAARIGAEQCLIALREASCAVDLAARTRVCMQNGGCASVTSDPAASR